MSDGLIVILAAHGAGEASAANSAVQELASRIEKRRDDLTVWTAFQLGHPSFSDLAERLAGRAAVVVPLLSDMGHHRDQLASACRVSDRDGSVRIAPPLGTLSRVRAGVIARVARVLEGRPGPVAIVVVGHGTDRNPDSSRGTHALTAALRTAFPTADVRLAFLDQEPRLASLRMPAVSRLVVVPWFLGGGPHTSHDIPTGVKAAVAASGVFPFPGVHFLPPIGEDPDLVETILREVDAHAPTRVLRLGSRGSRLALRQAEMVADALTARGTRTEIVPFTTTADRDLARALDAFPTGDPFAAELEEAVLAGSIDLAVHSLKDMDWRPPVGTEFAALLPRGPAGDVLVSRDGRPLARLAPGSRVGTSSVRRRIQVAALRPDLEFVPVRGTVEARLRDVTRGFLDAVVLAEAGLVRLGMEAVITERFGVDCLVPAPGQGVIAVTARIEDHAARELLRPVNDPDTARVVSVERVVTGRVMERYPERVVAVHATTGRDLEVRVRLISRLSGTWHDVVVAAAENGNLVDEVVRRLEAAVRAAEGGWR